MKWLIVLTLSRNAADQWQPLESHTRESLRGLGVSGDTAWVTGTHGTYLLGQDGRATWIPTKCPARNRSTFAV